MLGDLWKTLLDYLKRTPAWPLLEPVLLVGFLYVGVCVVTYQYVQWRYQVTLELVLFLQSYLLRQVSVGFAAIVAAFVVLTAARPSSLSGETQAPGAGQVGPAGPPLGRWRRVARGLAPRMVLVLLIGGVALYLLKLWTPEFNVSPIRVRFAAFGTFAALSPHPAQDTNREKTAAEYQRLREIVQYLLYEINHRQRAWQLEFDTHIFRADLVSKADEDRCAQDDTPSFCILEAFRAAMIEKRGAYPPLVLVTADPLGGGGTRAWFWLNRGPASVVTTYDWGGPGSPGVVEFLAYAVVVQSLMIHLQAHCGYSEPPAGGPEGIVVGNVFDLEPGLDAMRSAVLSGHLSREEERRLLNCLGPEYMRTATSLLSLTWLRTAPVRDNLHKVYGVVLLGS